MGLSATLIAGSIAAGAIVSTLRSSALSQGIEANERAVLQEIDQIARAQEEFRRRGEFDADGDGRGEFGYLQELAGVAWRPRERPVLLPVLPRELGESARTNLGIASSSGYLFLVYLPGMTRAEPESAPLPPPPAKDDPVADRQEARFILYSWPRTYGETGRRAFVVDHERVVFATTNDENPYEGARSRIPAPGAACDRSGPDPGNLGSPLAGSAGGAAIDGRRWTRVSTRND